MQAKVLLMEEGGREEEGTGERRGREEERRGREE